MDAGEGGTAVKNYKGRETRKRKNDFYYDLTETYSVNANILIEKLAHPNMDSVLSGLPSWK